MITPRLATKNQTWAIFCMTGWDIRNCGLTLEQASVLISDLKNGKPFEPLKYNGAKQIRKINNTSKNEYAKIWQQAQEAGKKALQAAIPIPMIVEQHSNMMDDSSPIAKSYYVSEGACGFAWIEIHPARGKFVNWCRSNKIGSKGYYGGWHIWISEGGQSIERKEQYAKAASEVLRKYGIEASYNSRLD